MYSGKYSGKLKYSGKYSGKLKYSGKYSGKLKYSGKYSGNICIPESIPERLTVTLTLMDTLRGCRLKLIELLSDC